MEARRTWQSLTGRSACSLNARNVRYWLSYHCMLFEQFLGRVYGEYFTLGHQGITVRRILTDT